MGFIFEGLAPDDYDKQYSDWELLKRIFQRFLPYRKMIFCFCG